MTMAAANDKNEFEMVILRNMNGLEASQDKRTSSQHYYQGTSPFVVCYVGLELHKNLVF